MTRFSISNRGRFLRHLTGAAAALILLATATAFALADDEIPGIELPKTENSKTDAHKTKAPEPKAAPAKVVWYKPEVADKILTGKGLKRLKHTASSVPWVLPADLGVTEKLADFAKVAAAQVAAAKKVKSTSKEISGDSDELTKAQARYSELKAYYDKPDSIPQKISSRFRSQQEMMQALVQELNQLTETINKLQPKLQGQFVADMPPPLKAAITEWMLARNNLILAYIAAKPDFEPLDKQYRDLAEEPEVAAALRSLGKKNHLGSNGFVAVQKGMAEAEKTAMSGEVPFYRQGALDSVGAILNEKLPVVILIQSVNPNSPNWAPTDVLAKAGVTVDPASPEMVLTFTGNGKRVIKGHMVTVPKLRFGKYVLENLKFLAMPEDAKDLGFVLASKELKDYDQTPDRDTWIYKFEKKAAPASDNPKPADTNLPKPGEK